MNPFARFAAALTLLLGFGLAQALEIAPYSPAALSQAQAAGKPVALHFHADWCPTCRAQDKAFEAMKSDDQLALTLLTVNYDTERALKQKLGVRTQSTVIVYRGSKETARLAGETDPAALRKALQSAL